MKVETRLLQLILSAITFDRVTIGVLHWDETTLRVASYLDYLNLYDLSNREDVRKTAHSIIQRAKTVETITNVTIDKFFDVRAGIREGRSPTIYYSPAHFQEYKPWNPAAIANYTPPNPQNLFDQLCSSIWGQKQYKIER
jgi:hypothetical protein